MPNSASGAVRVRGVELQRAAGGEGRNQVLVIVWAWKLTTFVDMMVSDK